MTTIIINTCFCILLLNLCVLSGWFWLHEILEWREKREKKRATPVNREFGQ